MKKNLAAVFILVGVYVLSYVVLSSLGAYAPSRWGLGQHGMEARSYAWAPRGFYAPTSGEWIHTPMRIIYAPLSLADDYFWHSHYHPEDTDPTHPAIFTGFKRK